MGVPFEEFKRRMALKELPLTQTALIARQALFDGLKQAWPATAVVYPSSTALEFASYVQTGIVDVYTVSGRWLTSPNVTRETKMEIAKDLKELASLSTKFIEYREVIKKFQAKGFPAIRLPDLRADVLRVVELTVMIDVLFLEARVEAGINASPIMNTIRAIADGVDWAFRWTARQVAKPFLWLGSGLLKVGIIAGGLYVGFKYLESRTAR
jgi:hypothetical protein